MPETSTGPFDPPTTSRGFRVQVPTRVTVRPRPRRLVLSPQQARRVALCLIAAFISPAGCRESAQRPDGPLRELRLGYFANLAHAQAVLGVASGDFAAAIAPTKLISRVFNAGPSIIEALFAGELDVGYIGPGPVLNAHQKSGGQGICVIAGASANGVLIVARAGSSLQSLADLKGRKVATPQFGNTQDIAARHYLIRVLGQKDADNVLAIPNAEQAGMMVRGEIDAAWVPEPWASRLVAEAGARIIAEEKDLWPDKEFSLAVVVTTPQFLTNHREVLVKLLAAHTSWTRRLNDSPADCLPELADALLALTGKRLPEGILPSALARTRFTDRPLESTFRIFGQWSHEIGFAKRTPDLTGLLDTAILDMLAGPNPAERSPTRP